MVTAGSGEKPLATKARIEKRDATFILLRMRGKWEDMKELA